MPLNHARKRIGRPPPPGSPPCVAFVCRCFFDARTPLAVPPASILAVPSFFRAIQLSYDVWFNITTCSSWVPRPGDLVFFAESPDGQVDHVAFVERIDLTHSLLWVIAARGEAPDREGYRLSDDRIIAFARVL